MPQANITYDAPYNRHLVGLLEEMDKKHWEKSYPQYHPDPLGYRLGTFHGEKPVVASVRVGGGSHPLKYNPAGNSSAYPPMSMLSGLAVSSGGARLAGQDGAVGLTGGVNPFDWGYHVGHDIIGPALFGRGRKPRSKKGGDALGTLKNLGHLAGEVFNIGGGPAPKKRMVKERATAETMLKLKSHVAPLPAPRRPSVVSQYKGPSELAADALVAMKEGGKRRGKSARAEIVKKVMKERGVKMIEASKIVKAEGLY